MSEQKNPYPVQPDAFNPPQPHDIYAPTAPPPYAQPQPQPQPQPPSFGYVQPVYVQQPLIITQRFNRVSNSPQQMSNYQ
jgi:hypothetical protein